MPVDLGLGEDLGTQQRTHEVHELVAARNRTGEFIVEIPRFQRTPVWSDDQKMQLVASLVRGYPIGALILYADQEATARNGMQTFLLVDGLQRLNALAWFLEKPLLRLSLDALEGPILDSFRTAAIDALPAGTDVELTDIDDVLLGWLRELKIVCTDLDGGALENELCAKLSCNRTPALGSACRALVNDETAGIRKQVGISEKPITVLVYSGDKQTLPRVFRDINTAGTKLSQYDILNALWVNEHASVEDEAIVTAIDKRYQTIEDAGFFVEERPDGEFNLYEYLLGLGKYALGGSAVPHIDFLLSKRKGDEQADAVLFTVTAIAHGLRYTEMGRLPERMNRRDAGAIDPSGFQDALLGALRWVVETLSPTLNYRFKGSRGAVPHTELQVASIVARVLVGRYVPGAWTERPEWAAESAVLRRTLVRHYVLDILKNNWTGSGDSRLFNMVWDSGSRPEDWTRRSPSAHYLTDVSDDQIRKALESYLDESLRQEDTGRRSASPVDRLILKLAYLDKMRMRDYQNPLDIDHLQPVALLQRILRADQERSGWPINSVGNLAAVRRKLNRSRRDQSVADYVHAKPEEREGLEGFLFLAADSIKLPYGDPNEPGFTDFDDYVRFLKDNFAEMTAHVVANMHIGD
jgi:hypothetical protein